MEGRNANIQDEKRFDSIPGEETKRRHNDMLKKERDDQIQEEPHRKERNGKIQGKQGNKRNNSIHGGQGKSRENDTQRRNGRERHDKIQRVQRKKEIQKVSRDERGGDYTKNTKETNSDHMHGVKKRECIDGIRRIWRTRMTCTSDEIRSELSPFVSLKQICYKTKFEENGKLIWWFVIYANEHELMTLEKNWHKISSNTHWKLEKCFKPFKGHPQLEHNKHDDNYLTKETDIAIEIQPPSSDEEDEHSTLQEMSVKDLPTDFKRKGVFHCANKDEDDPHQPLLSRVLPSLVSQNPDATTLDMNNASSLTTFASHCTGHADSAFHLSHATSKMRSFLPEKLTSKFFDDDQPQFLSTLHTSSASKDAAQKESTSVGENIGSSLGLSHAMSKVESFIAKELKTSQSTDNIGSNDQSQYNLLADTTADENVSGESSLNLLSHATKEVVSFATKKLHASQVIDDADSGDPSRHVLSNLLSAANTAVTTQIKQSTHDLRHATSLSDLADQCKKKGQSLNFMGLGSHISKNVQKYSSQLLNEVESAAL